MSLTFHLIYEMSHLMKNIDVALYFLRRLAQQRPIAALSDAQSRVRTVMLGPPRCHMSPQFAIIWLMLSDPLAFSE